MVKTHIHGDQQKKPGKNVPAFLILNPKANNTTQNLKFLKILRQLPKNKNRRVKLLLFERDVVARRLAPRRRAETFAYKKRIFQNIFFLHSSTPQVLNVLCFVKQGHE